MFSYLEININKLKISLKIFKILHNCYYFNKKTIIFPFYSENRRGYIDYKYKWSDKINN